jgi:hypothetical protein
VEAESNCRLPHRSISGVLRVGLDAKLIQADHCQSGRIRDCGTADKATTSCSRALRIRLYSYETAIRRQFPVRWVGGFSPRPAVRLQ